MITLALFIFGIISYATGKRTRAYWLIGAAVALQALALAAAATAYKNYLSVTDFLDNSGNA